MSQKTDGLYYLNNHFNSAVVAYDEVSEKETLDINRKQESVQLVVWHHVMLFVFNCIALLVLSLSYR